MSSRPGAPIEPAHDGTQQRLFVLSIINYSRRPGLRRSCPPGVARGSDHRRDQYSMMRVTNGVMPDVRTGLIMTFPPLPDASSIWPLPR